MSIALAVALTISIRVSEASIVQAFEGTAKALAGKADLVVTRGTGIELAAVPKIEQVGRLRAAPVIQDTTIAMEWNEPMIVFGIDFARDAKLRGYRMRDSDRIDPALLLLDPNAVLIPKSFAERHGLRLGSTLRLDTRKGTVPFRIAGILDDTGPAQVMGGRLTVMGVKTAARHFGRGDRCDRIDVALEGATAEELRRTLGPEYRVEPTIKSSPTLEYLISQQRTVLLGITVIAALVGAFIVYNSASLSVVERVKDIGILRALGARRREVVGAFLIEAALLGTVGAVAGIALGSSLARYFISQAVNQMNILVHLVEVKTVVVPIDAVLLGLAVGVLTAIAGALAPALEASRVPPMAAIRAAAYGRGLGRGFRRNFFLGAGLLGASAAWSLLPGTVPIVVALAQSFFGIALALPQVLLWSTTLLRWTARRFLPIEGTLAVDTIVKFPARSALTVLAFAASLSMIVAIAGTSHSLKSALNRWFDQVFPFDLTIMRSDLTSGAYSSATFPEEVLAEMEADPRVERAYGVRAALHPYRRSTIMLLALDLKTFAAAQSARGIDPGILARAGDRGVVLSKNFVALHGAGSNVELETPDGIRSFPVVGVVEDYSWPNGVVLLDRALYRESWKDSTLSYIDLQARPGTDLELLRADLSKRLGVRTRPFVYTTREARTFSLKLVQDWFRLADAQVFLSVIIGSIGVINTLLISVLTRSRQFGLLRAVGATQGQIAKSVVFEATISGIVSGVLGCAIGLFFVRFPLSAMTLRASGYELPFAFPARAVVVALVSGVVIALLASVVPARFARRVNVIEAIGYE